MNQGQLLINMQHLIVQLEKLTRSSLEVDYYQVRKICREMEENAEALSDWAMKQEEDMDIDSWKRMRAKNNLSSGFGYE
jgi:hypothetical protein